MNTFQLIVYYFDFCVLVNLKVSGSKVNISKVFTLLNALSFPSFFALSIFLTFVVDASNLNKNTESEGLMSTFSIGLLRYISNAYIIIIALCIYVQLYKQHIILSYVKRGIETYIILYTPQKKNDFKKIERNIFLYFLMALITKYFFIIITYILHCQKTLEAFLFFVINQWFENIPVTFIILASLNIQYFWLILGKYKSDLEKWKHGSVFMNALEYNKTILIISEILKMIDKFNSCFGVLLTITVCFSSFLIAVKVS